MQSRSRHFHLLVGVLAGVALLSLGTARVVADTIDLSAILTSDCAMTDGADLALLDDMQGAAAPATPAEPAGKPCTDQLDTPRVHVGLPNTQCAKGSYCAKEVAACKGEGTCKEKPKTCTNQVVDPVCGCNHKTYNNECLAQKAGVNIDHKGNCEKKGK